MATEDPANAGPAPGLVTTPAPAKATFVKPEPKPVPEPAEPAEVARDLDGQPAEVVEDAPAVVETYRTSGIHVDAFIFGEEGEEITVTRDGTEVPADRVDEMLAAAVASNVSLAKVEDN